MFSRVFSVTYSDGEISYLSSEGFTDVAVFDFTLVTVALVTGKEYGLDSRCTFIQTVF